MAQYILNKGASVFPTGYAGSPALPLSQSGMARGGSSMAIAPFMAYNATMLGLFGITNIMATYEITRQREAQRHFTREQNIYHAARESTRWAREDYEWNRAESARHRRAQQYLIQKEIDLVQQHMGPTDTLDKISFILDNWPYTPEKQMVGMDYQSLDYLEGYIEDEPSIDMEYEELDNDFI